MLNVQNIAEFMHLVNGMKETIEVLEAYGIKVHWNNSKEGRTFLSGLQQMGKIYHLFAVEQYQILRESIRAEMNKKASI